MGIIAWIVFGFVIGLIARAVVPGKQGMGFIMTTLLGVGGALLGGLVSSALFGAGDMGRFEPAGFIGALIGAIALLLIFSAITGPRRRTV